ncbi:MAG: WD40/YVTN/BNR-like repeat-containing protein [Fibrobacterota bacterium]|nr:hypothetical protein [Chitinispirillaceae bacterium]
MLSNGAGRILFPIIIVLFAYQSFAQWTQTSGLWGGQVRDIAVNNGAIFTGTEHGLFISTDNGDNWARINNCPIGGGTFAVKDNAVYASTWDSFFVTNDKGKNWTDLSAGLPPNCELFTFAIKGDTIFAGFDDDPIHFSTDNGHTWKNTEQLMTTSGLWVFENTLFAGGSFGLTRSEDNGKTWDTVFTDHDPQSFITIDTILMVATENGILRSADRGVTWDHFGTGLPNDKASISDFAVASGKIFAASPQGVYISTDKGANWTLFRKGLSNQRVVSIAVNGSAIFAGTLRGVFRSEDGGASWEEVNRGMTDVTVNDLVVSDDLIAAGCDGGIALSYDKGKNWRWADIDTAMYVLSLVKKDDLLLAGTVGSGLFRSIDNGKHWNRVDSTPGRFAALSPGNGVFFCTLNDHLCYSSDSGRSWTPKWDDNTVAAFVINGDSIILGTWEGLWRSPDNGATWEKRDSVSFVNYGLPGEFLKVGATLYSAGCHGIYRSNDNGEHWTDINAGLGDSDIQSITAHGTTLFISTNEHGVYMSTNNGEGWTPVESFISNGYINILSSNATTLYAGALGKGLWERPISDIAGSLNRNIRSQSAERFSFAAYSAPAAKNCTAIDFSITRAEHITIRIFNVSGRETASIVNARLTPGKYSYQWNTTSFNPGRYIAQIKAGSDAAAVAITVLR